MALVIQDPENEETDYLIESLLEASLSATEGAAVFSFASVGGARMLLNDDTFRQFMSSHPFALTIGIDAVTTTQALNAISEAVQEFDSVSVSAFLHSRSGALFHPKMCWFSNADGGIVVAGSGNLTLGGLRSNWEAYLLQTLDSAEFEQVRNTWDSWLTRHGPHLLPLDDGRVIAQASQNSVWANLGDRRSRRGTGGSEGGGSSVQPPGRTNQVLIAEIPRSGNRWNQANFDLENYEGFFGARRGTQRRMVFQSVATSGELGEIEVRPSVAVASHNWRFELEAAAGLAYPRIGRPIGVFVRVAVRTFRYMLIMPRTQGHRIASRILNDVWRGPATHVRRVRIDVETLREYWPDSPLLQDEADDAH
jgi:hypothetical protein